MLTPDGPFPVMFGQFRVLEVLGRGGMGVAYLAEDTSVEPGRRTALKVPRSELLAHPECQLLFKEAGTAARLPTHPNLCPLYGAGVVDGVPYLSMEYLPGGPLVPRRAQDPWKATALLHTLALAMHEAHKCSVIHRDLKPGNMLYASAERLVITDFGLALPLHLAAGVKAGGGMVGTPGYMSPEQAGLIEQAPTAATDIFSLGVILYELLTGTLPFPSTNPQEYRHLLAVTEPIPPSAHRLGLSPVLDGITLKAMAKNPQARYADMGEFADALARSLFDIRQGPVATPRPSRPLVPRDCFTFLFVDYGSTTTGFTSPQDRLFLDVGNNLLPGVLDHHHLANGTGSTCRLVLERPHFLDAAVRTDRLEKQPFYLILHEKPDLDGVAAAYLACAYLSTGEFPAGAGALSHYVDHIDQGHPGWTADNPFSLYAGYIQLCAHLERRWFNTVGERWQERVRGGMRLVEYALSQVATHEGQLWSVDVFDCPGLLDDEDRQDLLLDQERYRHKLADPRVRARRTDLQLPGIFGSWRRVPALLVRDVQNPIDPDRCNFFKDWARTDREQCPQTKGFVVLCVFMSEGPRQVRRCIISVRPDTNVCLADLGLRLDRAEAEARRRVFGLDDRVINPVSLETRLSRPGYGNADPWYDGRGHCYTIINSPSSGTYLTADAIEGILLQFGHAGPVVGLPPGKLLSQSVPASAHVKKIALFCSSFDPPSAYHTRVAVELRKFAERVVILPYGPRPDRSDRDHAAPIHRAALADLAFRNLPGVEVDLSDLDVGSFTRTRELEARYASVGEVWHVIPDELVTGGPERSRMRQLWEAGSQLWQESCFFVVHGLGQPPAVGDLPHRSHLLPVEGRMSSAELRHRVFQGLPIDEYVSPEVDAYIRRQNLFTTRLPDRETILRPGIPRLLIVGDDRNEKVTAARRSFERWSCSEDPNLILVLGGDGTMLHAICERWRLRVPFFGINFGHLGFLLNEGPIDTVPDELVVHHLPMLHVEMEDENGKKIVGRAFGDAWVEREGGQSAWLSLAINGEVRVEKLVADGMLTATPSGSSAYARAMGAASVPLGARVLTLVGSHVFQPDSFKPMVLPNSTTITLTSLDDLGKRPVRGFLDGRPVGRVRSMSVRLSTIAGVELAFARQHDLATKLLRSMLPPPNVLIR